MMGRVAGWRCLQRDRRSVKLYILSRAEEISATAFEQLATDFCEASLARQLEDDGDRQGH